MIGVMFAALVASYALMGALVRFCEDVIDRP